ncbi:hypothetical protein RFI_28834 [Reticulomyxa filosa]|uniref:Uncharacterized protein n=1 Tax=Reticulomyxa filosa TaxID=46433 RepID=X6M3K4_RETFI|nr:hypothetical protein RFI_28834 [Reticulomyxa filosa]|eukprot:ETO08553.1 hypothetical protein RFI_28834 [Reticulomyxa filosa]
MNGDNHIRKSKVMANLTNIVDKKMNVITKAGDSTMNFDFTSVQKNDKEFRNKRKNAESEKQDDTRCWIAVSTSTDENDFAHGKGEKYYQDWQQMLIQYVNLCDQYRNKENNQKQVHPDDLKIVKLEVLTQELQYLRYVKYHMDKCIGIMDGGKVKNDTWIANMNKHVKSMNNMKEQLIMASNDLENCKKENQLLKMKLKEEMEQVQKLTRQTTYTEEKETMTETMQPAETEADGMMAENAVSEENDIVMERIDIPKIMQAATKIQNLPLILKPVFKLAITYDHPAMPVKKGKYFYEKFDQAYDKMKEMLKNFDKERDLVKKNSMVPNLIGMAVNFLYSEILHLRYFKHHIQEAFDEEIEYFTDPKEWFNTHTKSDIMESMYTLKQECDKVREEKQQIEEQLRRSKSKLDLKTVDFETMMKMMENMNETLQKIHANDNRVINEDGKLSGTWQEQEMKRVIKDKTEVIANNTEKNQKKVGYEVQKRIKHDTKSALRDGARTNEAKYMSPQSEKGWATRNREKNTTQLILFGPGLTKMVSAQQALDMLADVILNKNTRTQASLRKSADRTKQFLILKFDNERQAQVTKEKIRGYINEGKIRSITRICFDCSNDKRDDSEKMKTEKNSTKEKGQRDIHTERKRSHSCDRTKEKPMVPRFRFRLQSSGKIEGNKTYKEKTGDQSMSDSNESSTEDTLL